MIHTIVSFDPGKTTGMARIDIDVDKQKIIHEGLSQVDWDHFVVILNALGETAMNRTEEQPITFVMEDFMLYDKTKVQLGSRFDQCQVIGAVRYAVFCSNKKIKLIIQPSSIKPTAEKWSGRKTSKTNHAITHEVDAYNHAYFFAVKNKLLKHRMFDEF